MHYIFEVTVKDGYSVEAYAEGWIAASHFIQKAPGARGTRLHRKIDDPTTVLAIATWDSKASRDAMEINPPEEIEAIPKNLSKPALFNMASSGKTPFLSREEIASFGYKLAIYPNFAMLAAIPSVRHYLAELHEKGSVSHIVNDMASFQDLFNLVGMDEVKAMEERYSVDKRTRVNF